MDTPYHHQSDPELILMYDAQSDHEEDKKQQYWIKTIPGFDGPLFSIHREKPTKEDPNPDYIAHVAIDLYQGVLSVIAWNDENEGSDPYKIVLCENIHAWQPPIVE